MNNEEKILEMLGQMQSQMTQMQSQITQMHTEIEDVKTDTRQTRMIVEQQQHQIQLIAEQYGDVSAKLDKANENAAGIGDLKERVRILENIVMSHTAKLKEFSKAQ